jgi:hypothetical protein
LVDISAKNSTNNLLLLGIVARVTEADVKTSGREDQ